MADRVDAAPFRWTQIESTDYRIYMKNLQAIGCPEQTVRDIVTADVGGLYKARRAELERKLNVLAASPLSTRLGAQSMLEAELRKLPVEEDAVLAELVGSRAAATGQETLAADAASRRQTTRSAVSLPLVLAELDLSALNLDQTRIQVIKTLRQRFIDELNGTSQDPNDPAYLERWQQGQTKIDSLLKGMIGIRAFQQLDLAARAGKQQIRAN